MSLFAFRKMHAVRLVLSAVFTLALAAFLAGRGGPVSAAPSPALYLFSILNNNAPIGPQTYTSKDGVSLLPLTKPGGANIVPNIPQFRDGRFLRAAGRYYYSYTHGGGPSQSIGLIESTDLQNWTAVPTPSWTHLYKDHENAIWNGAWWNDNGTYFMFFGVCHRLVPTCRPYVVGFDPSSNTFGAPLAISFTTKSPHDYNIVMSIFRSAGKDWALLQTLDATRQSVVALASFTSLSHPWTTNWRMIGGQPTYRESGAAIVLPNGHPQVYYVRNAGGQLFYTTADGDDPGDATWSTPQVIPPFRPADQPADWVDVVPIDDTQTLQAIANLRARTAASARP